MSRPTTLFTRSLAVAALVGGLALSPSLYAATPKTTPTTPPSASMEGSMKDHKMMSPEMRIEERVKELHDKLKITDDQAQAWNNVADTMRDNEKSIHVLIQERHEKMGTRTALEDLDSYQKIAAAHAEGLGKFIQVFQPLYDSMSDAQKKYADTVFGTYEGHGGRHGHMMMGGKGKMEGKGMDMGKDMAK